MVTLLASTPKTSDTSFLEVVARLKDAEAAYQQAQRDLLEAGAAPLMGAIPLAPAVTGRFYHAEPTVKDQSTSEELALRKARKEAAYARSITMFKQFTVLPGLAVLRLLIRADQLWTIPVPEQACRPWEQIAPYTQQLTQWLLDSGLCKIVGRDDPHTGITAPDDVGYVVASEKGQVFLAHLMNQHLPVMASAWKMP